MEALFGEFYFFMGNLENVKVGDLLLVLGNLSYESLEVVIRITDTLVITKYRRFKKKNGLALGSDTWNRIYARPANDKDIAMIVRKKNIRKCKEIKFESLTDSQLQEILNIAYPKNEN